MKLEADISTLKMTILHVVQRLLNRVGVRKGSSVLGLIGSSMICDVAVLDRFDGVVCQGLQVERYAYRHYHRREIQRWRWRQSRHWHGV